MVTLDETLFGRIAIFNKYLRQDQLDECLTIQRTDATPRFIGDILLEKGYLKLEQLNTILEIRRKKIRKIQKKPGEAQESNRVFGDLTLLAGLITLDDLEGAVLEQERLSQINLHFCLGEVLVAQGKLKARQVIVILGKQGKCILLCPICESHFNVVKYRASKTYSCPQCSNHLIQPRFLDTIAVDGVIEE